jgi:hypothetical protein
MNNTPDRFAIQCKIGYIDDWSRILRVTISFAQGRLSIIGETFNGGGQCYDELGRVTKFDPMWTPKLAIALKRLWLRWHLNDLTPGSPQQERFLRHYEAQRLLKRLPVDRRYDSRCEVLKEAGLYYAPDLKNSDGSPYVYGRAWLEETVPLKVREWLLALPQEAGVKLKWK